VGSLPKDVLLDSSRRIVGYMMDTVDNGINMEEIVFARNPATAFYKHRNKPNYDLWLGTFLYQPPMIRNRFILCYYLAHAFDRMYSIRTKSGQKLDVEICNFDIKPKNVLVSIDTIDGRPNIVPFILDLDNVTISNETGRLAPLHPQFTPEYRAPEGPIDRYYDYYSIAVLFYQLIFDIHPFNVLGGTRFTDGTEMEFFVRNKCFAWGRNRKFLSQQTQGDPRHNNYTRLSSGMQGLFLRAFDSDLPSQRPTMKEWINAFEAMLQDTSVDFKRLLNIP
jgi:serine/threonine protein kinase